MLRTRVLIVCAVALVAAVPEAHAQLGGLRNRVRDQLQRRERPTPAAEEPKAEPTEQEQASTPPTATTPSAAPASASLKPGEGAWANYDFVPGDRILFAEDFTADRVGNFPRRLELEKGTFEVVDWNGRRWLRVAGAGEFTLNLPSAIPDRWTLEFELTLPSGGMWFYPGDRTDLNSSDAQSVYISMQSVHANIPGKNSSSLNPSSVLKGLEVDGALTRPVHVRLQADGGYFKVYLDEQRVINVPNMGRWPGNKIHFYFTENYWGGDIQPPLMTALSLNAGGAEFYDALMAGGRLAVPGIYFDTGSDRIRPESSGTLREILDMLGAHPDLRLTIEGHTDNVGDPAKNRTLSEQRAAAVVTYLVDHGAARARLQSTGLGDTKPAAPNDSPENRQRNRRVELVVQK